MYLQILFPISWGFKQYACIKNIITDYYITIFNGRTNFTAGVTLRAAEQMPRKHISIITASYNCERYIDDTIRSVVLQRYPELQYIVVDAASTDGTPERIKAYGNAIDVFISEPDEGMYYGIQKGSAYVEGEVMAWLNADDVYMPWTFSVIDDIFRKYPNVDWIIGQPAYLNKKGQCIKVSGNAGSAYPNAYIRNGWFRPQLAGYLQQESMFWRKSLWEKVGGLNLELMLAADFDLWTRFARHAELYSVATPLACFRLRPGEQNSSKEIEQYNAEVAYVSKNYATPGWLWDLISKRGEFYRILCRLMIWKKCKYIAFSSVKNDWVIKEMYRPLSRYSLADALLEYQSRSK